MTDPEPAVSQTVTLPLWMLVLVVLLAAWTLLSRLLMPSIRWFFRRRLNRLIEELNKHLAFELPPIALTKRQVLIDRLMYAPRVMRGVAEFCESENAPREVAMARVERYAQEIVPAFNPYVYFRLASGFCDRLLSLLYRVHLGYVDRDAMAALERNASIVFVMNHRSNVDYLLVSYLTLREGALSYAVGEWARVWPLQQLIRALGGYFVRRGSGDPLYRRVLERYVQMAVDGGAVQAVFPEGGLSRDGRLRRPRIGLLDYMLRNFDADGGRDIVFIPVGINYDRVLEDRSLLRNIEADVDKRSGFAAIRTALGFAVHNLWLRATGRWYSYGYASANFGTPVSLQSILRAEEWRPRELGKDERIAKVTALARRLMRDVGALVPVLPVSLVATVLLRHAGRGLAPGALFAEVTALGEQLSQGGARVHIPRGDAGYALEVGLRMLRLRHLVVESGEAIDIAPGELPIVRYYANAIEHLVNDPATDACAPPSVPGAIS